MILANPSTHSQRCPTSVLPESLIMGIRSGNRTDDAKSLAKRVNPSLLEREKIPPLTFADHEIPRDSTICPSRETLINPPSLTPRNDSGTIPDPAPTTLRTVDASPPSSLGPAVQVTQHALIDALARRDVESAWQLYKRSAGRSARKTNALS